VKSPGAGKVVDYLKEDFAKTETQFDGIFDAVAKITKSICKKLLKPTGIFVSVSTAKESQNDLFFLKEFIEAGKIRTVIDKFILTILPQCQLPGRGG
jgi:hypothetical protein